MKFVLLTKQCAKIIHAKKKVINLHTIQIGLSNQTQKKIIIDITQGYEKNEYIKKD